MKPKLHIIQLGKIEQQEILDEGAGLFASEDATLSADKHGELLTATVATWLTKTAITVFVTWLTKRMETNRIEHEVVMELPNGSKIRSTCVITTRDIKKATDEVLTQLNNELAKYGADNISD